MKAFVLFTIGLEPLEVDELPIPLPDNVWIYQRDTNQWFYPAKTFTTPIPEALVPKQFRLWRLVL